MNPRARLEELRDQVAALSPPSGEPIRFTIDIGDKPIVPAPADVTPSPGPTVIDLVWRQSFKNGGHE